MLVDDFSNNLNLRLSFGLAKNALDTGSRWRAQFLDLALKLLDPLRIRP